MAQELRCPNPGDLVRARGDAWRVLDLTRYRDCAVCRLGGARPSNRGVMRTLLLPFDRVVPAAGPRVPARAGRRRVMRALAAAAGGATPAGGMRAAGEACFDLVAYQLEPALACLAGETRLLIADEVGLGKTVQASLVLAEIFARDVSARGLVLAPASLCSQWIGELRRRFALPAVEVDASALRRLVCLAPPGVSPWSQLSLAVTSFDFVKQPEVLSGMTGRPWDALVVDEAHMVALARERSRAVAALARRSRRVVLLTATPNAGDLDGFSALCETGRMPGERPIVLFRRTRAGLGLHPSRRVVVMRTRLSAPEQRMHHALERYAAAVWRESAAHPDLGDARLAMMVLRKRASSGAGALAASLSRRLSWLSSAPVEEGGQLPLPLDERDADSMDEEPDAVLGAPGLIDRAAERRRLAALLDLATAAMPGESKLAVLERLLARVDEPAIVFTEYRDTLSRIAARLSRSAEAVLLHGGLDLRARDASIRAFETGRARLLLATDAAAQGLNLQSRCRLVVNVELPWTPARLEQRIGRVDRIGQRRRVHAIHLVARGTAEEDVLDRLRRRFERERDALGDTENPVGRAGRMDGEGIDAGPLAGNQARAEAAGRRSEPPFRLLSLSGAAASEVERLELVRRLGASGVWRSSVVASGANPPAIGTVPATPRRDASHEGVEIPAVPLHPARPCWTVLRLRHAFGGLSPGVCVVFVARVVDGRGSLLEQLPLVLHLSLAGSLGRRARLEDEMPRLLNACSERVAREARRLAHARLVELRQVFAGRMSALSAREGALAAWAGEATAPLQPGLFDRRALKQAEAEAALRAASLAASEVELEALAQAATLDLAGDPELVFALGLAV